MHGLYGNVFDKHDTCLKGEYKQNMCKSDDISCLPCPERLPSCVGLGDGPQPFTGQEWTSSYVVCLQNRTIDVRHCSQSSIFNPDTHQCINKIDQSKVTICFIIDVK